MRCTKCSFISFDDLSTCAKCASDLSRLSKELNGTCTETRQEFFLGTAIQTTGMDEDNFSDSQMLPPIDKGDMNFDDTSTGGFSPLSSPPSGASSFGFDDSVNVTAEDDVAIELGDIMPIDFEQLDSGSVLSEGPSDSTDALAFDDFSFNLDETSSDSAHTEKEIDFDLTDGFADSSSSFKFNDELSDIDIGDLSRNIPVVSADLDSSTFDGSLSDLTDAFPKDASFELDHELFEHLADASGSFDETTSLDADVGLNETEVSRRAIGDEKASSLELDESLVTELAGYSPLDASGEFPMDFSVDHSESGDFELDAALVAELSNDEESAVKSPDDAFSATVSIADTAFDNALEFEYGLAGNEILPVAQVEDVTEDFSLISEDDDAVLSGLDLADIDVSDLVDTSDSSMTTVDADGGSHSQQNGFAGQSGLNFSGEDTLREEGSSRGHGSFGIQSAGDDVSAFAGGLLGEGLEEIDDIRRSGSGIDDLDDEIDLLDVGTPQDFNSSFLDDTFREGEPADVSEFSSGEDLADDILEQDELVLDQTGDDGVDLLSDIDVLALDADFEAFLNKTALGDKKIPEIELVSDDDDGPPDLPS